MADAYELQLMRDVPSSIVNLESLRTGDVDGDGRTEVVVGGDGGLLWYRPATAELGFVGTGHFGVSLALEDLDGDGVPEIVAGREQERDGVRTGIWTIVAFKRDSTGAWEEWLIVPAADGEAHDVAFADLDGDGVAELVANAPYCDVPGTLAYKRGGDPREPWARHELVIGVSSEGLEIADVDGDGRPEVVHGPDVYFPPDGDPLAGPWAVRSYAPSFRDMGRVAVFDVTGNGRPDIVCSEAEYVDGRLSWFENRVGGDGDQWVEHQLERGLYYAHSLSVWRDGGDGAVRVFVGEMGEGGWRAPRYWPARLVEFRIDGAEVSRRLLAKGTGTHEALLADVDDDGELEIVGKAWREPAIQIWKRTGGTPLASRFEHKLVDRDKDGAARAIVAADFDGDGAVDLACGARWYRAPDWAKGELAHGFQALDSVELDGRSLLVGTLVRDERITLVLLSQDDDWQVIDVLGDVPSDWPPEGAAPVAGLSGASPVVAVAGQQEGTVTVYERDGDEWRSHRLDGIDTRAGLARVDLDGDGSAELLAGISWIRRDGDGWSATPLELGIELPVVRVAAGDVDGDGQDELVVGTEGPDVEIGNDKYRPLGRLFVCSRGEDGSWSAQLADSLRTPRCLAVADVDGDGVAEIVCGEHDPSWPYRTQSRLYVYRLAHDSGRVWARHTLEDRFEHDGGPCVFPLADGGIGIASHGSSDTRVVHLWQRRPS